MTEYERVLRLEEILLAHLGVEGLFSALTKAMSLDELEDNYLYIARMEDIDFDIEDLY